MIKHNGTMNFRTHDSISSSLLETIQKLLFVIAVFVSKFQSNINILDINIENFESDKLMR